MFSQMLGSQIAQQTGQGQLPSPFASPGAATTPPVSPAIPTDTRKSALMDDFGRAISSVQQLATAYPGVATQLNQALQLLLETMVSAQSMAGDSGSATNSNSTGAGTPPATSFPNSPVNTSLPNRIPLA